jgi:uncharacterized protein (DUF302 family)
MTRQPTEELVRREPGTGRTLNLPFTAALQRVDEALRKEGFGVLTRIDLRATMQENLGVEVAPCVILGACNPTLAHQALTVEPEVALMLPCNVVVRDLGKGRVRIEAVNALAMMSLFPKRDLLPIAIVVNEKLARVIDSL